MHVVPPDTFIMLWSYSGQAQETDVFKLTKISNIKCASYTTNKKNNDYTWPTTNNNNNHNNHHNNKSFSFWTLLTNIFYYIYFFYIFVLLFYIFYLLGFIWQRQINVQYAQTNWKHLSGATITVFNADAILRHPSQEGFFM